MCKILEYILEYACLGSNLYNIKNIESIITTLCQRSCMIEDTDLGMGDHSSPPLHVILKIY